MLVTLPNKNPFFSSPMPKNPKYIRERLFQGIDKDYNVTDMGIVIEVLGELENFHMSREELEDTRLGKHINELRRKASDNKELATRAKSLIKKWRDLLAPESGPPPGGGNNNNNNSNLVTNGNSRLSNSHTYPGSRAPSHPAARGSNSQGSPRVPTATTKLSPSANSSQRPTTAPSSASSQSARSNVRNNGPNVPSPAVSKALPGSGSRDSPVVISSGSSSPISIQSVQDIMSQLPPIDSEKILADLEENMAEEEPEMDGLIPAFKPRTEVTSDLVENLNNGQLDHIGGIRDYQGDFKEWHQMASLPSKDGELLHILPYSLID